MICVPQGHIPLTGHIHSHPSSRDWLLTHLLALSLACPAACFKLQLCFTLTGFISTCAIEDLVQYGPKYPGV